MAWCRGDDKPLSEPMMIELLAYTWLTQPQWINTDITFVYNNTYANFCIRYILLICIIYECFGHYYKVETPMKAIQYFAK